jgi:DNA methyltransferase 1-associated protein 1
MEDLKARFYSLQKSLLELQTKREHMDQTQYQLWQTLDQFNPAQEASRKKLAEGHLFRRQTEVDEESVLLSELQRIMINQATTDSEREDLRRRLDYPRANTNGYQYTTSQALTGLWQQLLAADRMKKNARLRPTGHTGYDGFPTATPTSARPRESNAGLHDMSNAQARRGTRDSLPSAQQNALPVDLSKADLARFGVVQNQDKLPSGVTFASDKLSKPRIAKSTVQTDKIATILQYAQVPELIPLPTPAVVEQFDAIMSKVHTILDLRKLKDKEEQEIKVREAEAGQ